MAFYLAVLATIMACSAIAAFTNFCLWAYDRLTGKL